MRGAYSLQRSRLVLGLSVQRAGVASFRRAGHEVVRAAVAADGSCLQYAAAELQADAELARLAVSTAPGALQHVSDDLRRDRAVSREDWHHGT